MVVNYGSTPGVSIDVEGGTLGAITVGREEYLVVFARGDPNNGNASTNSPTQVTTTTAVENEFGEGTRLAEVLKDAIFNGANARGGYVYGVMPATQAVTGEVHDAVQSFTIGNAPIIEDLAEITIRDTVDAVDLTVEFRYTSPPATPSNADTAFVNPFTGEVETDSSSDYEVDYKYLDWSSAFDSADTVVGEGESGVYVADTLAESVASTLFGKAAALRDPDFRMIKAFVGALPNANTSESPPDPMYDTGAYTDNLDSLPGFVAAPARQNDELTTLLGAIGGLAAGNALDDPILTDQLGDVTIERGVDDEAILTKSERDELREEQVMPIRANGSIEIDGTLASDTGETWKTTYQSVRTIDRAVLGVREIARAFRGQLDVDSPQYDTEEIAAQEALSFLEDLVDNRLLQP
ncbi:MAG: hypothetical protein SV760_10485, partial [Halobacteria archaeon]|nr:hypothetical protein [Halobacteria archaeon]